MEKKNTHTKKKKKKGNTLHKKALAFIIHQRNAN